MAGATFFGAHFAAAEALGDRGAFGGTGPFGGTSRGIGTFRGIGAFRGTGTLAAGGASMQAYRLVTGEGRNRRMLGHHKLSSRGVNGDIPK